jgi:phosphoribosyl 1,2-cyclic phosphodiesterase
MKLVFLGTRANTARTTRRHRRHSALMVRHGRVRVMIDCGADWLGRAEALRPDAIVITHAHPDHAWGLRQGAPCPVYATCESWRIMADYPIGVRHTIAPRSPFQIDGIVFEAFDVEHSVRAPAVGYRIAAGGWAAFYAPDLVAIGACAAALSGIDLYVGDGATLTRSIVRRRGSAVIGHAAILTQLAWCGREGVRRAVFTHCGGEILGADGRRLGAVLRAMAHERGVEARFAYDGLEIALRARRRQAAA